MPALVTPSRDSLDVGKRFSEFEVVICTGRAPFKITGEENDHYFSGTL
jgi:hypothetical protein